MTNRQFRDWLQHHLTVYPSVRSWIKNQPDVPLLMAEWEAVLTNCSEGACFDISRRMLSGEIDRPYPEETATKVRIWASQADADEREDNRRTIENAPHNPNYCQLCDNTGIVEVFTDQESVSGHRYTTAVACNCSLGDMPAQDRKVRGRTYRAIPRFRDGNYQKAI